MPTGPSRAKPAGGARRRPRFRGARLLGRASIDLVIGYLLLGGGFVFLAFFIYTNYLIARLEKQADMLAQMFARFCAVATVPASQDASVRRVFNEVMRESHYPIVVTDARGVPWTWKGVGIDLAEVPFETFDSTDPHSPSDPTMKIVLEIVNKMDSK